MTSEILEQLSAAVVEGEPEQALDLAQKALAAGFEPMTIIDEVLVPAMQIVGEKFECGDYFLPNLIFSANSMQEAMKVLEPELRRRQQEVRGAGKVVIGTVQGDIHEIGKSLVSTMLSANGFQVYDLGVDVPTDTLTIPETDAIRPVQDLVAGALANRPDLAQAQLQVENSQIGLAGARNATLPQVDLVGIMQNNGLAGTANAFSGNTGLASIGGYGSALEQLLARNNPTYGVGVQVTLPFHNRIAEADLARDELQVKQSQIRARQLQNQARLEVEDALMAMRRARASYEAAAQARILQQQSLDAEQSRFEVGASTSFFVIQYESMLAQARSTEVAARSSYVKARAALARATGTILDDNGISFDAAIKGGI